MINTRSAPLKLNHSYFRDMLLATRNLYRNAFQGLSANTWKLSAVMLINRSGTMVIPFLTIYCTQQLHFTLSQAGIIMALFGIGAIVGAFFGGKITDHFGFYPLQVSSLLLGGSMFMILGFLKTFPSLCVGTFILSVCNESFRPANATAIALYSTPENRTRSYSLNRLAINLGWSVGGALGGLLASINYHLLFWVDGCTNIMAAVLLLKLLPYTRGGNKYIAVEKRVAKKSILTDKTYLIFIACTVLFASCFFQGFTMQPVFFKTEWHINERFIGFLLALNGIIIVIIEMIDLYPGTTAKARPFYTHRLPLNGHRFYGREPVYGQCNDSSTFGNVVYFWRDIRHAIYEFVLGRQE